MIRILSYNLLFGRRSKKIFPWIVKQRAADILCFQEFPEHKIKELLALLPKKKYSYAYSPSMHIFKKSYGLLTIFRADKLTVKKIVRINLGTNRTEKAILGTRIPRTGLLTLFSYRRKLFVLVNCHLVNIASNKLRYKQIQLILKALSAYHVPALIIGDFNIPSLIANKKLIVFMATQGFNMFEKHTATFRIVFIRFQMDYVFARKAVITSMTIDRKIRFSDHYPILTTVRL